jgi:hypothetical protein
LDKKKDNKKNKAKNNITLFFRPNTIPMKVTNKMIEFKIKANCELKASDQGAE